MVNFLRQRLDATTDAETLGSVPVSGKSWLSRFFAMAGPAYLVSVGYMDPGNWATDMQGGSQFGYRLLWVVLASSLMAILLQTLCARLGIVLGKDLAQACRDYYNRPIGIALWLLCEIAIIACDVAEVIGSAIALKLLFGIPLVIGVLLTGFDVLLLLGLMRFGFRKIEAIVMVLILTIFVCFGINIYWAHPDWGSVGRGLVTPAIPDKAALLIAVGILGATVMPHNLYLHSSIVQTRQIKQTPEGKKEAIKMASLDTLIALGGAFFVNAAILVLSAAVFRASGTVDKLEDAHKLLAVNPALGGTAATLFAVALLCSGQSSTITGTMAGQIVMEGFLNIKVKPWVRRLITRGLALIPAMFLVGVSGGDKTVETLVITQVILSMQLPFAVIPLVAFTSDRRRMGEFTNSIPIAILAGAVTLLILGLNLSMLVDQFGLLKTVLGIAVIVGFGAWAVLGHKPRPAEAPL